MIKQLQLCLILLMTSIYTFAQDRKINYSINGTIKGVSSGKIYLSVFGPYAEQDSAIIKNGVFHFKGSITEPSPIILCLDQNYVNKPLFIFFSDGGNAKVTLDKQDLTKGKVVGSQVTKDFELLESTELPFDEQFRVLFQSAKSDTSPQNKESIGKKRDLIFKNKEAAIETFIKAHPSSAVAAYATHRHFLNDEAKITELSKLLSATWENTSYGREIKQALAINEQLAIGKMAPNFTQNDTAGRAVSLSDFKGKYVLIDFWASWCGPCRAENPHVVKAYNAFKDKDFTILGVSLDQPGKKQAWLNAIHKDGLPWTHVSDLKGWGNEVAQQYGVKAVPANFLIDPNGKIIAKDLRGDQLKGTLEKIIGK